MKKKIISKPTFLKSPLIPGLTIFIMLGMSIAGLNAVYAQEEADYPPIVLRIAEKFDLNPSDVQTVFQEFKDEHQADRFAQFSERLNDLVADGKITEDQKQKILAKHQEMQDKIENLRNLDPEDRHTQMKQIHEDFTNWAEDNGIDLRQLGFMAPGLGGGFKANHMMRAIN